MISFIATRYTLVMNPFLKLFRISLLGLFFVSLFALSCRQKEAPQLFSSEEVLPEVEIALQEIADLWYPKSIDTVNGGFWSDFDFQWQKEGAQNKMLVSQARHIWSSATLAAFYNDKRYEKIAAHGYEFIKDRMWDTVNGGFYTLLGIEGDALKLLSRGKSAYGNSFAIYGLAAYYKVSRDTMALDLAKKTFYWLEEHAYDSIHKGYFDIMKQDGSWLLNVKENDNNYDNFARKDWKDQNSSIHLLECFTALYEVWPDALLKRRLEELLLLIRDTITTEKGYLTLHLQRDWTPISLKDSSDTYRKQHFHFDHVSFGHDVETAFLMLEASHILGRKHDTLTSQKAKKMVDHGIKNGWDDKEGGFFEGGYYYDPSTCTIENFAKVWWTQAEGLNSLLLMSQLYPVEKRYDELFKNQWHYLNAHMVDPKYGGWYHEGLDSNPDAIKHAKAHIWKVNYHNIRSLINVIKMLRGEFTLTQKGAG
ncbi:MAG: AGE family epimerase/isomerase [Aurantibacter sp.]